MKINFNEKKGFISDMDGVIYHGNQILPGVKKFIQWLNEEDKKYLFLTNNSGMTPKELQNKLARMGLDVPADHFLYECTCNCTVFKGAGSGMFCLCFRGSRTCQCPV